ncbi:MAG: hypothetical protein QY330_04285 [Candidatus Dojkabacteria bacterium]|nr:MAG: hypothetical protein QY330_04285 [Candidatus Dojkabacteria bacterium]
MSDALIDRDPMPDPHPLLQYETIRPGIEQYRLDLRVLYPDRAKRDAFEGKWQRFYDSDSANRDVFGREDDAIIYLSESLIPEKKDERPPLLMVFGNPAPHSIKEGMFFSYEGNGREHRIWKIFRDVGIVSFELDTLFEDPNERRKRQLHSLEYHSPFRIGMIPFYAMATTPSAAPWTGVSGLYRLFGTQAMQNIAMAERERLGRIVRNFMSDGGLIIAFQKDAYENLSHAEAPAYGRDSALQNGLIAYYDGNPDVMVAGSPPTRSLHGVQAKKALAGIVVKFFKRDGM